jgi:hypothetical protein
MANCIPIRLALASRDFLRSRPKKSSLNLIHVVSDGRRNDERGAVVDRLRDNDGLHKGGAVGHIDEFPTPRWDLSVHFVDEVSEVHTLQLPNRERKTNVFHGEIYYTNRETRKDVIKGNTTTPNRDDGALLEVGAKTGDLTKRMEDARKFTNVFSNGSK